MIGVTIHVDTAKIKDLSRRLGNIPKELDKVNLEMANVTAREINTQLIMQTKRASRLRIASRIRAKKLSKYESAVVMPQNAVYLDSMTPHYVSLKRGRIINRWVRNHYGNYFKSGRSRVTIGKRGGIYGFLYVTPDPFVNKALNRVRARFKGMLVGSVRKAMSK